MDPVARALAQNVGIVRGRDETDRLGGAGVEVARRVYALLHVVRPELRLVVQHDVVRRLDRAEEPRVRLEVKVKVEHGRHALVDDGSRARIAVLVGVGRVSREEPRVVSFAADDYAQYWVVTAILGVDGPECCEDLRQFVFENPVILTL